MVSNSSSRAEKKELISVDFLSIYNKEASKTGGDFRKLAFSYDTTYEGIGLKENLEVEIKCCTLEDKSVMYYPFAEKDIKPILSEYLSFINNNELIKRFELSPFRVMCIDPKRTLCDKISRLTRLSYGENPDTLIAKHIRDVYDIYCILNRPEYMNFVQSNDFIEALNLITNEDGLSKNSQSHNAISKAAIFAQTEDVLRQPVVSKAYHDELRKLIFNAKKMPELEAVIKVFTQLNEPLQEFDAKYRVKLK